MEALNRVSLTPVLLRRRVLRKTPLLIADALYLFFVLHLSLSPWLTIPALLSWIHLFPRKWLETLVVRSGTHRRPPRLTPLFDAALGQNTQPRIAMRQRWRDLLQQHLEPLELRELPYKVEVTGTDRFGIALRVPDLEDDHGGLELRFADRGMRPFTAADVAFIQDVLSTVRGALSICRAVHASNARERRRLARDLHDHVGATLLTMLRVDDKDLREMARAALQNLRQQIAGLRSVAAVPVIDVLSTWRAHIQRQCNVYGVTLSWRQPEDPTVIRLCAAELRNLFGIAQEAVTNSLRHSDPRNLSLDITCENETLTLTIEDDGPCSDSGTWKCGLGMRGMKSRASELGGTVTWENITPCGCRVTAVLPNGTGPAAQCHLQRPLGGPEPACCAEQRIDG